jgi:hypothetical protein
MKQIHHRHGDPKRRDQHRRRQSLCSDVWPCHIAITIFPVVSAFLATGCSTGLEATPHPPGFTSHLISSEATRLVRSNPMIEYDCQLAERPIAAMVRAEVRHQGVDDLPVVKVNGEFAGWLHPHWPSLTDPNYLFFIWDQRGPAPEPPAVDHDDFLESTCHVPTSLLRAGLNTITIEQPAAGTQNADTMYVRFVRVETIDYLTESARIVDLRRRDEDKPFPAYVR